MDEWCAQSPEIPLHKWYSEVGYGYSNRSYLSSYIHNSDPEMDNSNRCAERNVFYAGVFCVLMADDVKRTVITRESATRAFDAFHIDNRSLFNTFLYELLEDRESVM